MGVVIEGEVVLPNTVNCLEFFAPAREVLSGRTWVDVQQLALPAVEEFHGTCGIDCAIWFGHRENVNRKNVTTWVVSLMFAFSGPASRSDVEVLDSMMRRSLVEWSPSAVTGLTSEAFPTLVVKSGKAYQVWTRWQGNPVVSRLVLLEDGRVVVERRMGRDVSGKEFIKHLRHTMGVLPRQTPADLEVERMRVAFAMKLTEAVIQADGLVHREEARFLDQVFPYALLDRLGLGDPVALDSAYKAACTELPALLGHHDKLGFIGLLFAASHCDGKLATSEMKVLKQAADLLQLDGHEVVEYLRRIW